MPYKCTNPTSIKTGGVAGALQEKPQEEDCHDYYRDGDERLLPGTEHELASPFPAKQKIEHKTERSADELHVDDGADDQTNGGSQEALPDFPDAFPGALEDDAQHQTDDCRYEGHEHVIKKDIPEVGVHGARVSCEHKSPHFLSP